MAPPKASLKRTETNEASVSPPPTKRQKTVSNTTQKAVSNFFAPASKKEPEAMTWRIVGGSLLVGKFQPSAASRAAQKGTKEKVAIFDFDSTLISTRSGNKFAKDAADWQWWTPTVPENLKGLNDQGYRIAILSNQGGLSLESKSPKMQSKRLSDFKQKASVVLSRLDLPIGLYAATGKDHFRKPRTGMWEELLRDLGLELADVDLENSIFVGDAGGRQGTGKPGSAKDHACSDRDFAQNVGIPFKTPEEYFLEEAPQPYSRPFDPSQYVMEATEVTGDTEKSSMFVGKKNDLDIILFVGSPGSGKSTFYWRHLEPLGYERVNQDTLKTRDKCLKVASGFLDERKPVAVDNTNADPATRNLWIELAQKHNVPIRCILFEADVKLCEHNDAVRALSHKATEADANLNPEKREMLPRMAFTGFASRFREPTLKEGFQDITKVKFKFEGTEEQKAIWTKFWV